MDLSGYDEDDIEKLLHEQATILFKRCDYGNKNYVTRHDLLTLGSELDLPESQVTEAFDKLDVKNRDFLTLREFINGFGVFLGIEPNMIPHDIAPKQHDTILENDKQLEKAVELFNACDINKRGKVSLYDLKQLTSVLDLSEDQISAIFNRLDDDKNGFITLDEFVNGFSHFTGDVMSANENNNFENEANISHRLCKEKSIDEIYFMDSTQANGTSGSFSVERDLERFVD